jgi:hypothetical protein
MMATVMVSACSGVGGEGDTTSSIAEAQPIPDGTWFAFVTVGEDESGAITLGVDLADMLSGEEARVAAVEDGEISEGEDLPNDFYIDNDEEVLELFHVSDDAQFALISGTDTSERVVVDAQVLADLYEGTYEGEPIYSIPPGTPIAMDVTITDGLVSGAEAVYLP